MLYSFPVSPSIVFGAPCWVISSGTAFLYGFGVKAVTKLTNNVGGNDKNAAVTTTSDKLFLLSYSEIVPDSYWASSNPWTSTEGTQYEVFKDKVTSNYSWNDYLTGSYSWWERSVYPYNSTRFLLVNSSGYPSRDHSATSRFSILPAFCF